MKTQLITTLAVAAIGIVLAGCRTVGDGVPEQKTFTGMQVEAIEIAGPWTVEMNCGAEENSVTVTVEQNLWKYVTIRTGRKFRLALDKDVSFTLPLKLTINSTGNQSQILSSVYFRPGVLTAAGGHHYRESIACIIHVGQR